jgi:hypothetical protein
MLGWVGTGIDLRDILCVLHEPPDARGAMCWESLALQAGPVWETLAKHDVLL